MGTSLNDSTLLFKAFADETRLRILNLLSRGELCVCDVMKVLGEPQSKISRHFAYLRRSGLVESRKEGLWVRYRLSERDSKMHSALVKALRCTSSEVGQLKEDLKHLDRLHSKLVACSR